MHTASLCKSLHNPLVAVRLTVSIPDALAERMEPFKSQISPSELMQTAITSHLENLEASAKAKSQSEVLKAAVASFVKDREPRYIKAAKAEVARLCENEKSVHRLLVFYPELKAVAEGSAQRQTMEELIEEFATDMEGFNNEQRWHFIEEFATLIVDRFSDVMDEETELALL